MSNIHDDARSEPGSGRDRSTPPFVIFTSPEYRLEWPGHVFPTQKYYQLPARIRRDHPRIARYLRGSLPANRWEVERVHPPAYVDRVHELAQTPELAQLEFEIPVTPLVIDAVLYQTGGTIAAARFALETGGAAINLGGGFHHAFADRGEGFCFFNDVAAAIEVVRSEGAERVLVIDCDVHQGNGTAKIFQSVPDVFTFSIHQENNYPVKERSDLDIGLHDGAGDGVYLEELAGVVPRLLDSFRPDLVAYLAGADPYREDQLGGLDLTLEGLHRRDSLVFDACLGRGVPLFVTLAGGYAREPGDVVRIHTRMVEDLFEFLEGRPIEPAER